MKHKWSMRKVLMLLLAAGLVLLTAWCAYTVLTLRKVNAALADLRNPDPAISAAAVEELSRCTSALAIRRIIDASVDSDIDQTLLAGILAKTGEPAIRPLVRVMRDRSVFSRIKVESKLETPDQQMSRKGFAAYALGRIGAPAVPALLAALHSNDNDAREMAVYALGETHDSRAFDALVSVLSDSSAQLRNAAAFSLGKLADQRAVEPLIGLLKDPDRSVRWSTAQSLGRLKDRRAVEPLIAALDDAVVPVKAAFAEALGEIADLRAVEPLVLLLGDRASYVAGRAAVSLEYIGGETAKVAVDRYIADRDIAKLVSDYRTVFASGGSNNRYLLMIALERYGNLAMAEDFRWSGDLHVEKAARHWAHIHGLTKELEESKDSPDRPKWKNNANPSR